MKEEYEYKNLRICDKWLQIESCRKCLFEVLCHYQNNNATKQKHWENQGEDWSNQ